MTQPPALSPDARYAALSAGFFSRGDANPSEKKGFGSSALTVEGRIFAMLVRGRLVVKLPKARVDVLVEAGWGERFDANKGRPMKEWLAIDPAHDTDWDALAREALGFVKRPLGRTPLAALVDLSQDAVSRR